MLSTPPEVARELPFRDGNAGFSLILKRNCSISPVRLAGIFGALAAVSLAIGIAFAFAGAWLVLPFAGLEVLLLGAAFVAYARRAADYERIELGPGRLSVEIAEGGRSARYELDPRRVRVCLEEGRAVRTLLRAAGQELEVGRNLDAPSRIRLAAELERRLRI